MIILFEYRSNNQTISPDLELTLKISFSKSTQIKLLLQKETRKILLALETKDLERNQITNE